MMDITKWAEDLTEEVYNEWKTKYSFWKPGFAVFYSPVRERPELMIISLNPGGGEKDFQVDVDDSAYPKFQDGNFSLPPKNRYLITKYRFAKKVRMLFEGNEDILKTSVVITVLLFRSQKIDYWEKNNPEETRLPMERFAYDKVQEIMKKVKPKKVLVIGVDAYNRLRKNIIKIENENIVEKTTIGRIITAKAGQIDIFVIPHLTGTRVSDKNMEKMKKLFADFIASNGC
jgi:hypothetical protein